MIARTLDVYEQSGPLPRGRPPPARARRVERDPSRAPAVRDPRSPVAAAEGREDRPGLGGPEVAAGARILTTSGCGSGYLAEALGPSSQPAPRAASTRSTSPRPAARRGRLRVTPGRRHRASVRGREPRPRASRPRDRARRAEEPGPRAPPAGDPARAPTGGPLLPRVPSRWLLVEPHVRLRSVLAPGARVPTLSATSPHGGARLVSTRLRPPDARALGACRRGLARGNREDARRAARGGAARTPSRGGGPRLRLPALARRRSCL